MEKHDQVQLDIKETLPLLSARPPLLSDFLLPSRHEEVVAWRGLEKWRREARAESPDIPMDKAWPELHKALYRQHGLTYPPLLEMFYKPCEMDVLSVLPMRCRQIVHYLDKTKPLPEHPHEEAVDVGQMIDRFASCVDSVPCLLPNSVVWLRRQFRLVTPAEALTLQGLPLFTTEQLDDWSHTEINSLAGNAFCV